MLKQLKMLECFLNVPLPNPGYLAFLLTSCLVIKSVRPTWQPFLPSDRHNNELRGQGTVL